MGAGGFWKPGQGDLKAQSNVEFNEVMVLQITTLIIHFPHTTELYNSTPHNKYDAYPNPHTSKYYTKNESSSPRTGLWTFHTTTKPSKTPSIFPES